MHVLKEGNEVRVKKLHFLRASGRTIVVSLRRRRQVRRGTGRNGGAPANRSINERPTYFKIHMINEKYRPIQF